MKVSINTLRWIMLLCKLLNKYGSKGRSKATGSFKGRGKLRW